MTAKRKGPGRPRGLPKSGGRRAGVANKRTREVQELLDSMGVNPIEGMATLAQKALKANDTQLAAKMFEALAPYHSPKRRSVEQTIKSEPLDPEQAKQEVITYLSMASDEVREEIFTTLGLEIKNHITPEIETLRTEYNLQ